MKFLRVCYASHVSGITGRVQAAFNAHACLTAARNQFQMRGSISGCFQSVVMAASISCALRMVYDLMLPDS